VRFESSTMSDHAHFAPLPNAPISREEIRLSHPELPMNVKDAARFLGVSSQTVYLWVERKQIPHLRVMGRNIRFLRSDLEPFRAQFKYEVENGKA
jgi:excisionase family DNA binding protein